MNQCTTQTHTFYSVYDNAENVSCINLFARAAITGYPRLGGGGEHQKFTSYNYEGWNSKILVLENFISPKASLLAFPNDYFLPPS